MLTVEQALETVIAGFSKLGAETVSLGDGLGRVLAEPVIARLSHPPAAVSSMDGYAVRSADVQRKGVTLTRIGEAAAGLGFEGTVGPGQCTRIFTGAPLPPGADAVIIQEDSEVDGDQITLNEVGFPGKFVRPEGLDFAEGKVLLEAGRRLTARDIGLAAAANVPWLSVVKKPLIGVLSTGNELVLPGEAAGADQIVNSNSVALVAYCAALGAEARNLGIAADTPESLAAKLSAARGVDLLVTTGGASQGDYDLVSQIMESDRADLGFYKVAMRPGKPLIFGSIPTLDGEKVPLLGMPGNPVSAGVSSVLYMRAAICVMLGLNPHPVKERAQLGADLPAGGKREDYLRATLDNDPEQGLIATPFTGQDSSMMARFADADCLLVREIDAAPAAKGEAVTIIRLDLASLRL
ncbi:MAG: gephyrin-like molybdotransferase Glp [Magnetovibrionaceae bacterium]